ncbi:MAG: amidase family protein [Actinomycetota bacterium]|jgi:amidase|nr:amidase family protein [Actinomycetota bacterium]MDA3015574.1 amidase family protein [Actinomycetota bacterium]
MATDDITLVTATDQLAALNRREISAVELLQAHLVRQDEIHDQVNAIVTLDIDRAMDTARSIDDDRATGRALGPMAGLPMTVKDALATAGIRSTGGAAELLDHVPDADAEVVAATRTAGAVIWGKSNLPRWSGDIQARNPMFGATNNPWDLTRGPGGSSGGAAAAVATGITPLEIGTDIGGSIRLPAHFSGVCGHKPSYGTVSQRGYIDRWPVARVEADINGVGPLARHPDDLELLLEVIRRPDSTLDATRGAARDLRVAAWLDDPACPLNADVASVLNEAVAEIEASGVTIDRAARPSHRFDDVFSIGLPLLMATLSPGRTDDEFDDLMAKRDDPDPTMRMRASGSTMSHREWFRLAEEREARRNSWADFFTQHDVLLAPVAFTTAFEHVDSGNLYTRRLPGDDGDRPYADLLSWTVQFGYVHLPVTVVPAGWTPAGLPVGIQIVGPYLGDRTTLEFARLVHEVTGGWRVPPIVA